MNGLLPIILAVLINFTVPDISSDKEDDTSRIVLNTYLPAQAEVLAPAVRSNLENKLNQIATVNGVGGSSINTRFIITAKINVLSKDITPTAPPMHAYTLDISLFIGDGIDGNLYATFSKQIKGVGRSEIKAYISALGNIKVRDKAITRFVEQGKQKIIDYYTSRCGMILKEAEGLADKKQYNRALVGLMAVPKAVPGCYKKVVVQATNIYKQKLENECQVNISSARAAVANDDWNNAAAYITGYTSDMKCYKETMAVLDDIGEAKCASYLTKARAAWAGRDASQAASYLAKVPANSTCSGKAASLADEIGLALDEKEKKEWELEYRKYLKDEAEQNVPEEEETIPLDKGETNQNLHFAAAQETAFAFSQTQHQEIVAKIDNWN